MSIPFDGFRFVPMDEELVGKFLFKKLMGTLCPIGETLIPCYDLYSKEEEPSQVFNRFGLNPSYGHNEECLYFFTQLKKKPGDSRAVRKVGAGTWHGEDSGKKMLVEAEFDDGQKVYLKALKKRFSYRNKKSDQDGAWIMHEFSVSEFDGNTEIVLCQLKKNDSPAVNKNHACKSERGNKKRKREIESNNVELNNDSDTDDKFMVLIDKLNKNSDMDGEIMVLGDVELNLESNNNSEIMVLGDELNLEWNNISDFDGDIYGHNESNVLRDEDIDDFIKSLLNPESIVQSDSDIQQHFLFSESIFAKSSCIL